MRKRITNLLMAVTMMSVAILSAGCGQKEEAKEVDLSVFAAKSLNSVMDELCKEYSSEHPNVNFQNNYDSSGTLMTQIKEGAKCNVFFSASTAQVDELEEGFTDGSIVKDSREDLLNNQVCLVTWKGSDTTVTGLLDMANAKNMALADATVPVGQYTRVALINAGMVDGDAAKPEELADRDISAALGGLEINNCANVGAVATSVSEGANEIGTVYYSDTFGYEDQLQIIEMIPNSLTGDVIYPVAAIKGDNISEDELEASKDFIEFLKSDKAKELFEKYHFTMN